MSDGTPGFDWPALMRVAFQGLGLGPDEFWRLTPWEFLILIEPERGAAPLTRDALDALLIRFPDTGSTPKTEDRHDRSI